MANDSQKFVLIDGPNVTILDPTTNTTADLHNLIPRDHHTIAIG